MQPWRRIDVILLRLRGIRVGGEMRWVSGAGGVRGMTRTKNTVSQKETGTQELKGARGARRAQTTSYRKSKELGRGKGANELHNKNILKKNAKKKGEKKAKNKALKEMKKVEVIVTGDEGEIGDDEESGDEGEEEEEEEDDEEEFEVVAKRPVAKGCNKAKRGPPKARSQQMTPPHHFQEGQKIRPC
ncbi:hypothetical protein Scep_030336 [Stephania cephalantha]|uniref:Uncharacterized protein n=1 Tax=Stephania cephalantha TaxID=152367 RepID=A0AAP0HIJ7_9MAGN